MSYSIHVLRLEYFELKAVNNRSKHVYKIICLIKGLSCHYPRACQAADAAVAQKVPEDQVLSKQAPIVAYLNVYFELVNGLWKGAV